MSDENSPLILPIATVQPSFRDVINDVQSGQIPFESFWVSCYKSSSPSVHGKVQAVLDEVDRDQVNFEVKKGDISIVSHGRHPLSTYTVTCPSLSIFETKIFAPAREYVDPDRAPPPHPHRITAFDVSPDGSQFATGFLDGSVHLYPTSKATSSLLEYKQISNAHKSTVTSLQFFPSSRVILSAGADFSINIFPAELQESALKVPKRINPVRTLRGHTRAVASTVIISRGRNILSGSSDSTVRLWDVSTGGQIALLASTPSPINRISLGDRGESGLGLRPPDGEEPEQDIPDPREVDTQDQLVFCALKDGTFEAYDVRTRQSVYQSLSGRLGELTSITYSSHLSLLATGSSTGVVTVYDTRALSAPLTSFSRNSTSVEDLAFIYEGEQANMVVAAGDGLAYVAGVRPEGPGVIGEVVGGDCDGVRTVRVRGGKEFWTASDDGVVRRYESW